MEALGRSAAGVGEKDDANALDVKERRTRDSPGGGSNIFKKIRDPAD